MSFQDLTTIKARTSYIKEKLTNESSWAVQGLLRIYEFQTVEEQTVEATLENNGVGFNGVDSNILSSFAVQFNTKHFLTPKQLKIVFKLMPKYAGQLERISK